MRSLLQHWVTGQAERHPDAGALAMKDKRLSYAQLEQLTNQLARILKVGGCQRGDRVGLLMGKSPTAIVSILGTLKADCICVPLDPSSPPSRLAQIIGSCEPRWILASGPVASLLDNILSEERFRVSISVGWMEPQRISGKHFKSKFSWIDLQSFSRRPLDYQNTWNDVAHILFTSGSTGTPKGVIITHANVIHFVQWAIKYLGISPSDRLSGHPPLHFDLSVFDIFGAFAAGAELHLVPPELNLLPNKLAEFIREAELTQWFSVPSILTYMAKFDVVRFNDFPALKRLLWCGEVFPTSALIYWMKRLPNVRFTNLYGPTETTIASSYFTVPSSPEDKVPIPIGKPCTGEELLVLNDKLEPVPVGEIGDLYIRGVGLSPGYWRDAEKTRAAFLAYPDGVNGSDRVYKTGDLAKLGENGLVYFLGRADSQIKSRGYRIELGEIETALNAIDSLQESAVVAIPTDAFEGATISCAYVAIPHAKITHAALREELGKILPPYMLPTRWLTLERLPRNANGKIDRRQIKEEFQRHATQTPGWLCP